MPSTILSDNGVSSGSAGLKTTAASDGILALQTTTAGGAATTAVTIDTSQNVGLGVTPNASWQSTRRVLQVGGNGALWSQASGAGTTFLSNNVYYDGTNFRYINTSGASYMAQQTNGLFSLNSAASGTAGDAITFTTVASVNKDTTFVLQGGTSSAGTGIAFPATQNASSNAKTLDDYEEGTWTPTVLGSSTNPTVTYQGSNGGRYIKIGKMVYLQCYLRWLNLSGGSGSMLIGGLPFTTANSTQAIGLSGVTEWNGAFPTNATYPTPNIESGINQTFLYVLRNGPGVSGVNVPISSLANADTYLLFGFCYESST